MKDFAAMDFETANECCSSVCSVRGVIVKEGEIANKFYILYIRFRIIIYTGIRKSTG